MAFAFGFPQDVTDLICSMRDWRWEMVRNGGKTPSAQCFDALHGHCDYAGEQPRVWTNGLPECGIESDSEEDDFGEIYNTDQSLQFFNDVVIRTHDERPLHFRDFMIRECGGRKPVKFRRLQTQNDDRIKEMWFQCEPATFNE